MTEPLNPQATPVVDLAGIAAQLASAVQDVERHAYGVVSSARQVGALLCMAKAHVAHGTCVNVGVNLTRFAVGSSEQI